MFLHQILKKFKFNITKLFKNNFMLEEYIKFLINL